jgi:hypothetical protein
MKNISTGRAALSGALTVSTLVFVLLGTGISGSAEDGALGTPSGPVLLEVAGQIEHTNRGDAAVFDREMLEVLPAAQLETTTVVTDGVRRFEGFYMQDLLDHLGATGETVTASALNDYVIDIPVEDFDRFDVVVATHMDGEQLERRDKGPLWIVYPRDDFAELQDLRYDYRWVWQLDRLEIR